MADVTAHFELIKVATHRLESEFVPNKYPTDGCNPGTTSPQTLLSRDAGEMRKLIFGVSMFLHKMSDLLLHSQFSSNFMTIFYAEFSFWQQ